MVVPCLLKFSIIVGVLFLTLTSIEGDRTSRKIYESISATLACFRRMNATHQIGCSSKLSGNVGVLHLVNSEKSLEWVTKTGPHSPYVVIMSSELFNRKYLTAIRDSGRVEGILLMRNETTELASFSGEKTCPNEGYGLYTNPKNDHYCEAWNTDGNGLLYENWEFPIFLIDLDSEAEKVLKCFHTFNLAVDGTEGDWPLCAAQLESHMLAAVDSRVCIRRTNVFSLTPTRICDPMGDYNIYGSIVPRVQSKPYSNGSVIVIGARLDASSLFDKLSPGADGTVSGFAALAAVLKLLAPLKEKFLTSSIENVYFMVFNGEAFDYIGSSRVVYDMKKDSFPFLVPDNSSSQPALLKLEHIKYFIEFNQVSPNEQKNPTYFVHSANSTEVQDLVSLLQSSIPPSPNKLNIVSADGSQGLPPSSFQSFRANKKNLPGIVITNHAKAYKNKYYNSIYDDDLAVGYVYKSDSSSIQGRIAELAATVARAVVSLSLPGVQLPQLDRDLTEFVDEVLYCYLKSSNCTLFTEVIGHQLPGNFPLPLYVGVQYSINPLTMYTRNLLAYQQGDKVNMTSKECMRSFINQTVEFLWINEECYATTLNYSAALSPAFQLDGEINWEEWNRGLYSTWTESVWTKLNVRIFLKPSRTHEILTLSFGIAVFLVSFVIVGWVSKKSDVIFLSRPDMIC